MHFLQSHTNSSHLCHHGVYTSNVWAAQIHLSVSQRSEGILTWQTEEKRKTNYHYIHRENGRFYPVKGPQEVT